MENKKKKSLFKAKKNAVQAPEANSSGASGEIIAEKADEILREFSKEDNTRSLTKVTSTIVLPVYLLVPGIHCGIWFSSCCETESAVFAVCYGDFVPGLSRIQQEHQKRCILV